MSGRRPTTTRSWPLAALCLLLVHVMLNSPIGYFMRAVRDDPMRAQSLGRRHHAGEALRLHASSAMAGLAGALYAHYVLTLTPSIVDFSEMARIIIMVVIGGLGSFHRSDHRRAADLCAQYLAGLVGRMEHGGLCRHRHRADARLSGGRCGPDRGCVTALALVTRGAKG